MDELLRCTEALTGNAFLFIGIPRTYEFYTDDRLYLDTGEKKDLETRLHGMISAVEVSAKLKEIEDEGKSRLAELEQRKEALSKLNAEVEVLKKGYQTDLDRALAEQAECHKAEVAELRESLATAEENAAKLA